MLLEIQRKMDGKSLLLAAIIFIALLNGIQAHRLMCKSNEFRCFTGKCIPQYKFCDGNYNCDDRSDEEFCWKSSLKSTDCPIEDGKRWFLCSNRRRCIPSVFKCDGRKDCRDGSDETACVQPATLLTTTDTSTTDFSTATEILTTADILTTTDFSAITDFSTTTDFSKTTDFLTTTDFLLLLEKIQNNSISSIPGVDTTLYNILESLKATRHNARSLSKWGPELPRIAVALHLTDPQFYALGNVTGAELAYELSLQMMTKLALKKKIKTQELALYVNALMVSCIDPKDFFGVNLVSELRKRVNNGNSTNPFVYLTLCNAGDSMTQTDVTKVASTFEDHRRPLWTDVQALATMAIACMNPRVDYVVGDSILTNMVKELKTKQDKNGAVDNVRTTALVMQALIATNSYLDDFDFAGAITYLVREAVISALSVRDMYYILPVLKSVSLVNVSSNHCSTPIKTELEVLKKLQESVEERIPVRVSMFLGNDVDFVRTWQLKVPMTYNFYQVLENIGTLEPRYKVHYSTGEDKKPYIVGIHKYFDDAEEEMFWFIFSQKLSNATKSTLVQNSPVDIQLKEDEELILWYRSAVWIDSP